MVANRADFRSFFADDNVSAVAAFPAGRSSLDIDFTLLDVGKQSIVAFFMTLFNFSNAAETVGEGGESLGLGFFSKGAVHFSPLFAFTGSGGS